MTQLERRRGAPSPAVKAEVAAPPGGFLVDVGDFMAEFRSAVA